MSEHQPVHVLQAEILLLRDWLTLARNRLHDLDAAIEHFDETLGGGSLERETAWRRVLESLNATHGSAARRLGFLRVDLQGHGAVVMRTGREREIGWKRVMAAMEQTFREAVILDRDMSDEQRAYWLAQPTPSEEETARERGGQS